MSVTRTRLETPRAQASRDAAEPVEAQPTPKPPETMVVGGMDGLGDALSRLHEWVGRTITVVPTAGDPVVGTLTGLRGSTVLLTRPDGTRWTADLLTIERVVLSHEG